MTDVLYGLFAGFLANCSLSPKTLRMRNLTSSGVGAAIASDMFDFFLVLAEALTIIYFLLELNKRFAFEASDITLKTFAAPFLKLCLAIGLMNNGKEIVNWTINFYNNSILAGLSTSVTEVTADSLGFGSTNPFDTLGLIIQIALLIPILIFFLVSLVLQFVYWYKTIGFKLEFYFRMGLTPIALADCYNDMSSSAIRWIKSLLGMGVYGSAFIILPQLCFDMVIDQFGGSGSELDTMISGGFVWDDMLGDIIGFIGNVIKLLAMLLLAPIAALGSLSAIRQAIKEVLG